MKLWELSGNTAQTDDVNPALRQVVVNEMRVAAPILEIAEFYSMVGNSDTPKKGATEQGGDQRAINSDFTGFAGAPAYATVALKIYGDTVKVDLAYERRGGNIESERLRELASFSRAFGRHITNAIVNASSSNAATEFDGLKKQLTAANLVVLGGGADGAQVILGSDNTAKKSHQVFLNAIDDLIYKIGNPSCFIAPPQVISYLNSIGREFVKTDTIANAFNQVVVSYKGIPVINAGYAKDLATPVIGLTETVGNSTDCTSIYAVRFGEKEAVTMATNVGVQVRDRGLVGSQYTTMVDFDVALAVLSPVAAYRLEGIRLA